VKYYDKILLAIFVVLSLIFILYPQIDITVSSLFYDGKHFYLADNPIVRLIYKSPYLLGYAIILLIPFGIYQRLFKKHQNLLSIKANLYIQSVFWIGVGVIVNLIFKDNFGRARPHTIIEFGGDKIFTNAYTISDQCTTNCSFVCGHASFGFAFIAFYFLYKKSWMLNATLAYGGLLGVGRLLQGGHFFSDVILSFFFVYFSALALYWFFYQSKIINSR
jgi:lipid A 4'-phosphatase